MTYRGGEISPTMCAEKGLPYRMSPRTKSSAFDKIMQMAFYRLSKISNYGSFKTYTRIRITEIAPEMIRWFRGNDKPRVSTSYVLGLWQTPLCQQFLQSPHR